MASSSHDHEYPTKLTASSREQVPNRRVDRAHRIARAGEQLESDAQPAVSATANTVTPDATVVSDDPIVALLGEGPHVNLQAEQLARLLADRLADIDRREAQMNVLAADLDNQQRTARLALVEREQELDRREAFLARLETSADDFDRQGVHDRLDCFVRADSGDDKSSIETSGEDDEDDEDVLSLEDAIGYTTTDQRLTTQGPVADDLAAALDERQLRLDAIRDTLIDEHRRLIDSRRTLDEWACRQRDEIERRNAELAERSRSVQRQATEVQRWRLERTTCYEELQRLRRSERLRAKSA